MGEKTRKEGFAFAVYTPFTGACSASSFFPVSVVLFRIFPALRRAAKNQTKSAPHVRVWLCSSCGLFLFWHGVYSIKESFIHKRATN